MSLYYIVSSDSIATSSLSREIVANTILLKNLSNCKTLKNIHRRKAVIQTTSRLLVRLFQSLETFKAAIPAHVIDSRFSSRLRCTRSFRSQVPIDFLSLSFTQVPYHFPWPSRRDGEAVWRRRMIPLARNTAFSRENNVKQSVPFARKVELISWGYTSRTLLELRSA